MTEKLVYDDYYRLWLLLSQTRSAIFKARHKKVGKYLPPNQAAALGAIWARDGQMTPLLLSRRLFLEPHTVSELIKRMQEKGLVTKEKDRQRGNVVRITITVKGQEVCSKLMGQDLIRNYMSALSEKQRENLRDLLTALRNTAIKELGIEKKDLKLFRDEE
jgi:DNA-binding MarR family transcriptional regulator